MIQIIVFYTLITIVSGLAGWVFFKPKFFPFPPGRVLSMAGAIILIASTLLLPWISAEPPEVRSENLAWFMTDPNPWWPARTIIAVREKKLPNPMENFDLQGYLCNTPELARWWQLLENRTSLSAWQLLIRAPTFSPLFKIVGWGRLVVSIILLVAGIVLPYFYLEEVEEITIKALGVLVAILFLITLFQIPGADTLGLRQEFKLDYINLLAGVQLSIGMWWSLVGLIIIIAGCVIQLLMSQQSEKKSRRHDRFAF